MFESDYARCEYIEKDNVVFHVWKKEAHFEDYRDPVTASLEMLREHAGSVFIVDARTSFCRILRRPVVKSGDLSCLRFQR